MIGEILFSTAQLRRFTTLVLLILAQFIWANPGFAQTPGGFNTNLELWLKADAGGTAWTDQSGNAVAVTQLATGTVTAGTTINFNPSNDISTAGGYDATTALATTDDLMLIAVFQDYTRHVVGLMPPAGNDAEDPVLWAAPGGAWQGFSDSLVENQVFTHALPLTAGFPHIGALYSTNGSGQAELMLDGLRQTGTLTIATGNRVGIGNDLAPVAGNNSTGLGLVSEVIVYGTNATAGEKQQIESYLALKYGITLDQTTSQNYVDSAGATTFDATAAGEFTNDIAGIARDDATALDQRISRSANSSAILTVSTDTDFTAANTTHANTLTDSQYLVWGNDGAPANTVITGVVGGTLYEGLARTWRYQDTGAVGPINMQFDLAGLGLMFSGGSGPQLVLSTDPTIGNADDVLLPATTVAGDLVTFQALDLADDTVAYFGLLLQPAPVDTDDDGLTDDEEIAAGTNPLDPNDPPRGIVRTGLGAVGPWWLLLLAMLGLPLVGRLQRE